MDLVNIKTEEEIEVIDHQLEMKIKQEPVGEDLKIDIMKNLYNNEMNGLKKEISDQENCNDEVYIDKEQEEETCNDKLYIKKEGEKIEEKLYDNENNSDTNLNEMNENVIFLKEEFFILDEKHLKKEISEQENRNNELNIKKEIEEQFVNKLVEENLIVKTPSNNFNFCQYCKKNFSRQHILKKHMLVHLVKPYKCKHCEKSFKKASDLRRHIRTHTGEKPYKCERCEKSFSDPSTLKMHIRTHTGEKPYKCENCKKSFSTTSSLKMHIRTHTGEKPYKCIHCDKAFSQLSVLQTHIRRHTGEKPYYCTHCDKACAHLSNLKTHIRTQHKCEY